MPLQPRHHALSQKHASHRLGEVDVEQTNQLLLWRVRARQKVLQGDEM